MNGMNHHFLMEDDDENDPDREKSPQKGKQTGNIG